MDFRPSDQPSPHEEGPSLLRWGRGRAQSHPCQCPWCREGFSLAARCDWHPEQTAEPVLSLCCWWRTRENVPEATTPGPRPPPVTGRASQAQHRRGPSGRLAVWRAGGRSRRCSGLSSAIPSAGGLPASSGPFPLSLSYFQMGGTRGRAQGPGMRPGVRTCTGSPVPGRWLTDEHPMSSVRLAHRPRAG